MPEVRGDWDQAVTRQTKMMWNWPIGWPSQVNIKTARAIEWEFRAFGYAQSQNRPPNQGRPQILLQFAISRRARPVPELAPQLR
jgi:hypothetical protein